MYVYISNSDHYKEVLSRVQSVKHTLWIATVILFIFPCNSNTGPLLPILRNRLENEGEAD